MSHHLGPPRPKQTGGSFDGRVPLSPSVVSPPTLTGLKPAGCPGEPQGTLGQPQKSISAGPCVSELPAYKCVTSKRQGEEGRGGGEGKGNPQTVASPPAPTIQTAEQPDLAAVFAAPWVTASEPEGVSCRRSPFSAEVRCPTAKFLAPWGRSAFGSCLSCLVVPAWLLLECDLSFCFLAGT